MFFDPRHAGSELGITEEQVRAIGTRTLLVHGREDKVVPVEVAWTMVRLLPNADLHVFARAATGPRSSAPTSSTAGRRLPRRCPMTMTGEAPPVTAVPLVDEDAARHRFRVHRSR